MIWLAELVSMYTVEDGAPLDSTFAIEISRLAGGPNTTKGTFDQADRQSPAL